MSEPESTALLRLKDIQRRIVDSTPALQHPKRKHRLLDQSKESRPTTSNSRKKKRELGETEEDIEDQRKKIRLLQEAIVRKEKDLQIREDRYHYKEQEFKDKIAEFEEELRERAKYSTQPVEAQYARNLEKIFELHSEVNSSIANIQRRTSQMLTDQQKGIQREFEARMKELKRELEEARKKKIEGAGNFAEKELRLTSELEQMKKYMKKIHEKNSVLWEENKSMKDTMHRKQEELNGILKEITILKKSQAELQDQIAMTNIVKLPSVKSVATKSVYKPRNFNSERQDNILKKLKHTLNIEKNVLEKLEKNYQREKEPSCKLEEMLRDCVLQVKNRSSDVTQEDVEAAVEMMLKQEGVTDLLYE